MAKGHWRNALAHDCAKKLERSQAPREPDQDEHASSSSRQLAHIGQQQKRNQLHKTIRLNNITTTALIDTGADGNYISYQFIKKHWAKTYKKKQPYEITAVDGKDIGIRESSTQKQHL